MEKSLKRGLPWLKPKERKSKMKEGKTVEEKKVSVRFSATAR